MLCNQLGQLKYADLNIVPTVDKIFSLYTICAVCTIQYVSIQNEKYIELYVDWMADTTKIEIYASLGRRLSLESDWGYSYK